MIFRRRGALVVASTRLVGPSGKSAFSTDVSEYAGLYDAAYENHPISSNMAQQEYVRRGNYGRFLELNDFSDVHAFAYLWLAGRDAGSHGLTKADFYDVSVRLSIEADIPYVPDDEAEPAYIRWWFSPLVANVKTYAIGAPTNINMFSGGVGLPYGVDDPVNVKNLTLRGDVQTDQVTGTKWRQETPSYWVGPFTGTKAGVFGQSQWSKYRFSGAVGLPFGVTTATNRLVNYSLRVRLETDAFIAETLGCTDVLASSFTDSAHIFEFRWLKPPLVQGPLDDPEAYLWYKNATGSFGNINYTMGIPFSNFYISENTGFPQAYPITSGARSVVEQSRNFEGWVA